MMKRFMVWLCWLVIRLLCATLRISFDDRSRFFLDSVRPPVIAAFWHNRTVIMTYMGVYYPKGRTPYTFISRSRDGQFITDVCEKFGIKAVRGSSSRHGSSALLAAIKLMRDSTTDIIITPDGPRGPKYEVHQGLIHLAQSTGCPIVGLSYDMPWKYQLKSWDRFHIPLPFSHCRIIINHPIYVPSNASEAELVEITARIKEALGGD